MDADTESGSAVRFQRALALTLSLGGSVLSFLVVTMPLSLADVPPSSRRGIDSMTLALYAGVAMVLTGSMLGFLALHHRGKVLATGLFFCFFVVAVYLVFVVTAPGHTGGA